MPNSSEIIQPGINDPSHADKMRQQIAGQVAAMQQQPVTGPQLTPATEQPAVVDPIASESQPNVSHFDFDLIATVKGKVNTGRSGNALTIFLQRLKRQHPKEDIVEKS